MPGASEPPGIETLTATRPVDAIVPFLDYCAQRLADDQNLWGTALFEEIGELGYSGSCPADDAPSPHRRRPTATDPMTAPCCLRQVNAGHTQPGSIAEIIHP